MDPVRERLPLVERYVPTLAETALQAQQRIDAALTGRFRDDGERRVAGALLAITADLSLLDALHFSAGAVAAGRAALHAGAALVVDDLPTAHGLDRLQLERLHTPLYCGTTERGVLTSVLHDPRPWQLEGMRRVQQHLDGAVVAIGWVAAALLYVLDRVDAGAAPPALIIAMPWGFVGVAEAKAELLQRAIPAITIAGTRGGAQLAAAAVNALLRPDPHG